MFSHTQILSSTTQTPIMAKKHKVDPAFSNGSLATVSSSDTIEPLDTSFHIEDDCCSNYQTSQGSCSQEQVPVHEEPKYIVFKSCLWQLFSECPVCASPCAVNEQCRLCWLLIRNALTAVVSTVADGRVSHMLPTFRLVTYYCLQQSCLMVHHIGKH